MSEHTLFDSFIYYTLEMKMVVVVMFCGKVEHCQWVLALCPPWKALILGYTREGWWAVKRSHMTS
jgi:hypothetical protein